MHNQGAVQVNAGTLNLGGNGGTHTGSFNALSGATLGFSGGTHNSIRSRASRWAAGGTLAASGGAVVQLDAECDGEPSGAISVSGNSPRRTWRRQRHVLPDEHQHERRHAEPTRRTRRSAR